MRASLSALQKRDGRLGSDRAESIRISAEREGWAEVAKSRFSNALSVRSLTLVNVK